MDGPFISVGTLKEKIFESKHLGRGTDFDLVVTNAQTNEEYLDEAMLIPKNTSVLIRRVPGRPRMPIVTEQEPKMENKVEDTSLEKSTFMAADLSAMKDTEDTEWDEFGNDLYAIPEAPLVQSSNAVPDAPPTNKADEDSKIKALIDTPALDWQRQGADGFGPGRGFGRGMGGRMGGRGFGRLGLEKKTPPQGYVCHRCKVPGHFIQHCPTNGDPNYDIKRVKPPTGIPKSMLMATPDGSYALPSGAVAVLKPNEAAFEKEIEGLPSTRSVGDLPPELHCPLCKEVMKDAVLTSKCCFKSFCDKCIRDYIISKAKCVCGATNILADDLLPNKTLRDTINRILESGNSSAENAGSTFQVQDMESARNPQPKIPSPTQSAASKEEQKPSPDNAETPNPNRKEPVHEEKPVVILQQFPENRGLPKQLMDLAEFGMGMNAGPPAMSREEFEARKADLRRRRENERRAEREFPRDREFGREVSSGGDISSVKSKSIPQSLSGDPYLHNHHRPERSSPERSARNLEPLPPRPLKRKSDHERSDRDRDRDYDYDGYDQDRDRGERDHHHRHHHRSEPSAKALFETTAKPASSTITDRKQKASVFSRISFPEEELTTKKRKLSSSGEAPAAVAGGPSATSAHHKSSSSANGYHESSSVKVTSVSAGGGGKKNSSAAAMDYESSDDERHFKRKPSRYEPSPPPPAEWEEDAKHSRGSRERERDRDRKHR
ncbi:hypothetical protein GH714_009294 [Hevea brasiliensis]|uniref:DWNN domain-containing protein n=1 Tax=Hevea brasiliensis TaxID=3981 RepID=A0A6A6MJH0_HEVBR|nr:hypothetical protein GH714_009294 [Hevea brasiliensis]